MEILYRKEGDYLLPDTAATDTTERPVGRYGRMRRAYIRKHSRGFYTARLLNGTLMKHLADIEEEAQKRIEAIMEEMREHNPGPDKGAGQVKHMNALHLIAEEIVIGEVIFS
jgi:hypothetical protein